MNKTYLIMIAIGLFSLILFLATPGMKKGDLMWMKLGNIAVIISIAIGFLGLVLLIKDLFS